MSTGERERERERESERVRERERERENPVEKHCLSLGEKQVINYRNNRKSSKGS